MDPQPQSNQEPVAVQTTPPPKPAQPVKKDGSNKLIFVTVCIILLGLGLVGGYMIANQTLGPKTEDQTPSPTITSVVTPTSPITPTTTGTKTKTVTAGLTDSTSFKPYSLEVPEGWTDVRENTQAAGIDKLTLSKNGYTLTIYQAAMGGGGCTYKGEPEQMMSQSFSDFADIKTPTDTFRRSWNQTAAKTISYNVCYKGTDGSYGTISSYGAISAVSPNPADSVILAEIDSMIASLKKK